MADNVEITAGSGTPVATDEIDGVHFQKLKLTFGVNGTATDVSSGSPFPVNPVALAGLGSDRAAVATPGTAVQLGGHACSSVTVRARPGNTGTIYIGGAAVDSDTGFDLEPGDAVTLDVSNTNLLWIDADNADDGVSYIWVA